MKAFEAVEYHEPPVQVLGQTHRIQTQALGKLNSLKPKEKKSKKRKILQSLNPLLYEMRVTIFI